MNSSILERLNRTGEEVKQLIKQEISRSVDQIFDQALEGVFIHQVERLASSFASATIPFSDVGIKFVPRSVLKGEESCHQEFNDVIRLSSCNTSINVRQQPCGQQFSSTEHSDNVIILLPGYSVSHDSLSKIPDELKKESDNSNNATELSPTSCQNSAHSSSKYEVLESTIIDSIKRDNEDQVTNCVKKSKTTLNGDIVSDHNEPHDQETNEQSSTMANSDECPLKVTPADTEFEALSQHRIEPKYIESFRKHAQHDQQAPSRSRNESTHQVRLTQHSTISTTRPYRIAFINCLIEDCTRTFFSSHHLNTHMWNVHLINVHRCPLINECAKSFANKTNWSEHMDRDHSYVTHWQCFSCSATFSRYQKLNDHLYWEHFEGRFECIASGCNFWAKNRQIASDHYRNVHANMSDSCSRRDGHLKGDKTSHQKIKSVGLEKKSSSRNETKEHSNKSSSSHNSKADSKSPSKKSPAKKSLSIKTKSKYTALVFTCLLRPCPELFLSKDELHKHLKRKHQRLPVQCPAAKCDQSFRKKCNLNRHFRRAHRSVSKHRCDQCNLAFRKHRKLYRHRLRWHHEGHFKCSASGCDRLAKYRGEIIEHFDRHHK